MTDDPITRDESTGFAALRNRSLFITGASSGLGQHFARLSARHGARIAIGARRMDRLTELAKEVTALGAADVSIHDLDVTQEQSVEAAVAGAWSRFGSLDVLVNNAGITSAGPAIEASADEFDRVLDTNLRGAMLMSTALAKRWRAAGSGGCIINIASILGLGMVGGVSSYAVSKAALLQMTKTHALEWARYGIRVNALAPGYIETELNEAFFASQAGKAMINRIPMRRLGRPEDLDGPFLLLASDLSRFMTGSTVVVDGGHLLSPI